MSMSVMGYSPESPRDMSPDTSSPFPDRPIRPMPKRRLRERLSPDVADSIRYPPAPKTTTPLFYHPYNAREDVGVKGVAESQHPSERERAEEMERGYITRKCGDELDSDEDDAAYRSRIHSRHSETTAGRSYRYVQKPENKNPNPQAPASNASSADSYDSFENTNNKKKRKIPTPGDTALNGGHLSSDMTGVGASDDIPEDPTWQSLGTVAVSSHGLSGPGRGRYGRIRNGRSPLRTLSDPNWGNGRTSKQRQLHMPQRKLNLISDANTHKADTPGIITHAIANANANKNSINPARGQENSSLLQQAAKKPATASTQFTFTCNSQVPSYPGPPTPTSIHQTPNSRMSTHATQTSPNMSAMVTAQAVERSKQNMAAAQLQKQPQSQPAPAKKNRRRTGKEYLIAARQRRQQQEFKNYHHPPPAEDVWICEFCEYERIFGTLPEALIKQYEIKDRRIRKQEAERRRLLEKAKMKGRKGKKGNKGSAKNASATQDRQTSNQHAPQSAPMNANSNHSQSQGTQSEGYYENDYEHDDSQPEEYVEVAQPPPPPSPTGPLKRRGEAVHSDHGKHRFVNSAIPVS
ncbi:hypothetical protein HYALB_00012984 [Hymenoscyphus albidus]|uniref:Uncharacterized protein n=1 Tax=Hymenoscyphus albidus TaxID=595503 RepID=A0A9N9LQ30_9HELO|nr:hypothetical protein HYALB_00012984 [Hymenoscyphus albidus]